MTITYSAGTETTIQSMYCRLFPEDVTVVEIAMVRLLEDKPSHQYSKT